MTVVVTAETRQQAIEKASAKASAKLPEVLGHMFPDDDDRRFAQLGPGTLDDMEEARDEVVIVAVGLPVLEEGTGTAHPELPSDPAIRAQPVRNRSRTSGLVSTPTASRITPSQRLSSRWPESEGAACRSENGPRGVMTNDWSPGDRRSGRPVL